MIEQQKTFQYFEKGILELQDMSLKQRGRITRACQFLNKYRHVRAEVVIEEISNQLTEDAICINLEDIEV